VTIHHRVLGSVVLAIYVDDILLIGNDTAGNEKAKELLKTHFMTKDMGDLGTFLRLRFLLTNGE